MRAHVGGGGTGGIRGPLLGRVNKNSQSAKSKEVLEIVTIVRLQKFVNSDKC